MAEVLYIVDTGVIKVAILLFYRRLSDRRCSNGFILCLYALITEVILYKAVYFVVILLICRPLQARWERQNPLWLAQHSYTCLSERLNLVIGSSISATEDTVIGLLPILILWGLQIPRRQKIAIWCLFALSIFTGMTSYVRTYVIYRAYWISLDYMRELYWTIILSALEITCALICSSIPALKPFLVHFGVIKAAKEWIKSTIAFRLPANPITLFTGTKSYLPPHSGDHIV